MFDMVTSVDRQPNNISYLISCDRKDITKLLAQMIPVWNQCGRVRLSILGDAVDEFITIADASVTQTMDVFGIDQPQKRIEFVKEMAVMNQMGKLNEYQSVFVSDVTAGDNLLRPSKPVLTTARTPRASRKNTQTAEPVNLTIIVR